MKIHQLHPWQVTQPQAEAIQKYLREWIVTDNQVRTVRFIARAQFAYNQHNGCGSAKVSLLSLPELKMVEQYVLSEKLSDPLAPNVFSFCKAPLIVKALQQLQRTPDLIICDGRGLIPPTRFGIASHIGLLTNTPTLGIRSAPHSELSQRLGKKRGSWFPLKTDDLYHSALLRVCNPLPPVYISIGHRIDLKTALKYTLLCIPESIDNTRLSALYCPQPFGLVLTKQSPETDATTAIQQSA